MQDQLFLETNSVDIVFLDIHMPSLNGIKLIEKLRAKLGENVPAFIFTTGDKEMALPAYECGAIGYVVKSALLKQFKIAVDRVIEILKKSSNSNAILNTDNDYFFIESEGSRVKLGYKDISYLESEGNYIKFNGNFNERSIYNRPMHYMESFLSNHGFIRVHKSFIISLHHVSEIFGNEVIVNVPGKDKKLIPIGATYKEELRKRIKTA